MSTADGNYCLKIKDPDHRQLCLKDGWHRATDPRVCPLLGVPDLEQACKARTALNKH